MCKRGWRCRFPFFLASRAEMDGWGGKDTPSRQFGSLKRSWNVLSGCVTVTLQVGRQTILLCNLRDQYTVLLCGSDVNQWLMVCLAAGGNRGSMPSESKDIPGMLKMPDVYRATMGETEQTRSLSENQLNGHDRKHNVTLTPTSTHQEHRHRHWPQTYSLDKLLLSSCFGISLGIRVSERTRLTPKGRASLYPSWK